jgi:hypothetical protein
MNTWDIFSQNDAAIREDFDFLTEDETNQFKSVNVIAPKYLSKKELS